MPSPIDGNNQTSSPIVSESSTSPQATPSSPVLKSLLEISNTVDALPGHISVAAEHNYALPAFGHALGNSVTSSASRASTSSPPANVGATSPQQAMDLFDSPLGSDYYNDGIHPAHDYPLPAYLTEWDSGKNHLFPETATGATSARDLDNMAKMVIHLSTITGVPVPSFARSYMEKNSEIDTAASPKAPINTPDGQKRDAPSENTTNQNPRFHNE